MRDEETYELVGKEENGLEGELPAAEVEQILETGSEEVHHHRVVVALGGERKIPVSSRPDKRGTATTAMGCELTSVPNHRTKGTPTPPASDL